MEIPREELSPGELTEYLKDRIDQIIEGGANPVQLIQLIEWWDSEHNPANPNRG